MIRVVQADLNESEHSRGRVGYDARVYALDEMGNGGELPQEVWIA